MVRAPRYGYQRGYASWQRQPLWQEGERIDKWNPYYRQDLTGADEEISLEDVEGGKPPTYVPLIDQKPLGYKDVLGPRNHPWEAGFTMPRTDLSWLQHPDYKEERPGYPLPFRKRLDQIDPGIYRYEEEEPGQSPAIVNPNSLDLNRDISPGARKYLEKLDSAARQRQLGTLASESDPRLDAAMDYTRRESERMGWGEFQHKLLDEPYWDWGGKGRFNPPGNPTPPPIDPNAPMSSLDGRQLALSENLPPAAGFGDIYDQMGETNRRNRGLGGLIRRVNPFDNAQPPPAPPAGFVNERPFEGNMPRPRPPQRQDVGETTGTYGGSTDLIAPPDKPQQDTQSVAAVFGGPQSGASSMLEDPRGETSRKRYEAARIAREAFSRDPSLAKEFLPKLRDAGVDPSLGAPEGWSLPEAPETWPKTPGFGTETEAERAARRAEQEAAYRRDTFPPGTGIPGNAVPGGPRPGEPLIMPPRAAAPAPYASLIAGRPAAPGPVTGLSQMTPNIPPARPPGGPSFTGNLPRPRPMDSLIAGRPDAPLGGMPAAPQFAGNMPRPRPETQFAMLENGPREWSLGIQTPGGQQSRLPNNRPPLPTDVEGEALTSDQRLAPFTGPAPPVSPELAAAAARATRPTDPFLTGLPAQGEINQTVPASPIDPAAIAEARRTLQLHPDTGRIRTAPGFQQFNEPARTRPVPRQAEAPLIRRDLTEAAANYTPPTPRTPRPRPAEQFGPPMPMEAIGSDVPGPQSGLPASVMENIARAGPAASQLASGGPAGEEVDPLTAAAERLAAERRRQLGGTYSPTDDLIAAPDASVPPITPVTLPNVPSTADMIAPAPLIAPSATSPINPRLSPKEIEKRARTRGFGTVENLTGDRWARGIGAGVGAVAGMATGNPLVAAGLARQGYKYGDDMRRGYMNRTGPFGLLGNIFGRGKDKDKNKNNDPAGIKEAAAAREAADKAAAMSGGSGLGSDRGGYGYGGGYYGGGSYPGYGGYGYGPGPDSIGGAYRNR